MSTMQLKTWEKEVQYWKDYAGDYYDMYLHEHRQKKDLADELKEIKVIVDMLARRLEAAFKD